MMKVKPVKLGKTERMSFSHIDEVISMPNLIEVQKNSYQWFLDEGLKEVFHDIGTIEDYTGNLALSFVDFRLDKEPKYSIKECKERDVTYAAPLRVTARRRHLCDQRCRACDRQPAGPFSRRVLRRCQG